MITITHDKILGFTPLWAPYNGFSLLFDNPDDGFSGLDDKLYFGACPLKLDNDLSNPRLALYQGFVEGLNSIDLSLLTNTYLFCPLPPSTYHVTVWDGLNDGNFNFGNFLNENSSETERWHNFRSNLHRSLSEIDFMNLDSLFGSPLVQNQWDITFQFDTLHKWSSGMGILLKPADQQSERLLKVIENHREELYKNFPVEIKNSEYAPHVTLGYFANKESAQLATPLITDWTKIFEETTKGLSITYNSIELYYFIDMITFIIPDRGE
jgi:hypothetical protein